MSATVYALFDKSGRTLYVGRTINPVERRVAEHRRGQPWGSQIADVHVQTCSSFDNSVKGERLMIDLLRPLYNQWRPGDFPGLRSRAGKRLAAHAAGKRCGLARCVRCTQVAA